MNIPDKVQLLQYLFIHKFSFWKISNNTHNNQYTNI